MLRSLLFLGMGLVALSTSTAAFAQPAQPQEGWARSTEGGGRTLAYASRVTILGQDTRLEAKFYCNTERTKMTTGAIGFNLVIADPQKLKSFDFDDFEGPDAPSGNRQLLTATIVRASAAEQRVPASPSGSFVPRDVPQDGFSFEVSEVFYKKGSPARRVLEELRTDATALKIVIVDYRVSTTRIELTIPMTGKSEDFRWLLADLK
jgi:hypothetical protein